MTVGLIVNADGTSELTLFGDDDEPILHPTDFDIAEALGRIGQALDHLRDTA